MSIASVVGRAVRSRSIGGARIGVGNGCVADAAGLQQAGEFEFFDGSGRGGGI
jgi:hypothetical protein